MLCILVMWGSGGKVVLSEQCLQLWITALICWVLAMICAGAWTLPTFYIFLNYINLRLNFCPLFPKKCMHRASPNFINSHIRLWNFKFFVRLYQWKLFCAFCEYLRNSRLTAWEARHVVMLGCELKLVRLMPPCWIRLTNVCFSLNWRSWHLNFTHICLGSIWNTD